MALWKSPHGVSVAQGGPMSPLIAGLAVQSMPMCVCASHSTLIASDG